MTCSKTEHEDRMHLLSPRQHIIPVHDNKRLLGLALAAVHQILQDLAVRLRDEARWDGDVAQAAPLQHRKLESIAQ